MMASAPTEDGKMNAKTTKLIVIGVSLVSVITIIALVLAFVGVAQKGANKYNIYSGVRIGTDFAGVSKEDKIWRFHIGHYDLNTQYLDEESGTIRGYHIDVVNAVCQLANKNCVLIEDIFKNCWDSEAGESPRGGIGLMSGWYDGCIGWINTRERFRTFEFTKPFEKLIQAGLFVKKGGSIPSDRNFTGLKIGFFDGVWTDEYCLNNYENITGFDVKDPNQVIHYPLGIAVFNALGSGEIDAVFVVKLPLIVGHPNLQLVFTVDTEKCAIAGYGIMTQKYQVDLLTWFNTAFDKLLDSNQYGEICDDLKRSHDDVPGRDPSEICVQ